MSKPYIPKLTVRFHREFDGKVERTGQAVVEGDIARALEAVLDGALHLAMAVQPQSEPAQ